MGHGHFGDNNTQSVCYRVVVCCRPEIDRIYHTARSHTPNAVFCLFLSLKIIINYMTGSFAAMVVVRQEHQLPPPLEPAASSQRSQLAQTASMVAAAARYFKRPVLLLCAWNEGQQPSRGTTPLPFLPPLANDLFTRFVSLLRVASEKSGPFHAHADFARR